jgi:hypothetical protein
MGCHLPGCGWVGGAVTISELIDILNALKAEHGDSVVVVSDDGYLRPVMPDTGIASNRWNDSWLESGELYIEL